MSSWIHGVLYVPVSYCDDSACCEFTPNGLLYVCVRLKVNAGRCFVDADYPGLRQQGTGQTHKLTLTHGEDTPPLLNLRLQTTCRDTRSQRGRRM